MADEGSLPADIIIDGQIQAEREDLIVRALSGLGVSASVRILPTRRAVSDLQWLVLAVLPLQAFLTSIGGKMADDAYKQFQAAVRKLLHPGQPAPASTALPPPAARPMVLQDAATGLQIILERDLPAKAYEDLLSLKLASFRLGPVHYDRSQHRWRSELDEARADEGARATDRSG